MEESQHNTNGSEFDEFDRRGKKPVSHDISQWEILESHSATVIENGSAGSSFFNRRIGCSANKSDGTGKRNLLFSLNDTRHSLQH